MNVMKRLEFPIEYSFDAESNVVIATVPELNWVSSFGKDFAEAESNVMEAVLAYLEALQIDGLPLPEPRKTTGTLLVVDLAA